MTTETAEKQVTEAGMQWHEAPSGEELAQSLGQAVAERLQQSLQSSGAASLVVSGGSTPAPVFKYLSGVELDWEKVVVTLADERWVPPGHPDSNESLVRDTLLQGKASAAQFVSLFREGLDEAQAQQQVAVDVQAMHQPFSVVMLGMGGDGHTASLFPDAPEQELAAGMALDNTDVVAFLHPRSVDQARISLTRACLLNAEYRFLHITGEGKRGVLLEALQNSAGQPYKKGDSPIVGLLTEKPERASVYWSP